MASPGTGIQDTLRGSNQRFGKLWRGWLLPQHMLLPKRADAREHQDIPTPPSHGRTGRPLLPRRILSPVSLLLVQAPGRCQAHTGESGATWALSGQGEEQLVCLRACRELAELPRINQRLPACARACLGCSWWHRGVPASAGPRPQPLLTTTFRVSAGTPELQERAGVSVTTGRSPYSSRE